MLPLALERRVCQWRKMVTRLTSKRDQQKSSRSSELSEYYNCKPKKGEKAQPHFRIIVPLKKQLHTLSCKHTQIHSVMHKHSHVNAYYTHTHRPLLIFLTHTHTCMVTHACAQNTQTSTNAVHKHKANVLTK